MGKEHDSSALAKQVAERLHLSQAEGLELYKELSQMENGLVKDVLDILSQPSGTEMNLAACYPAAVEPIQKFGGGRIVNILMREGERNLVPEKKLHMLHKYAACIKGSCVRDAQYAKWKSATPMDDTAWEYANDMPLFLGIVRSETPEEAKQFAASSAGVDESVIELYDIK